MNPIVAAILAIEGITLELLVKAGYQLRKRNGRCVHPSCKNKAVIGQVRCERHRQMNNYYSGISCERKVERKCPNGSV